MKPFVFPGMLVLLAQAIVALADELPAEDVIQAAFEAGRPTIEACAATQEGTINVRVVLAGATGVPTNIEVFGDLGDYAKECVRNAISSNLRVPPFTQPALTVEYTYRLQVLAPPPVQAPPAQLSAPNQPASPPLSHIPHIAGAISWQLSRRDHAGLASS
jgi:hypothetical protein